MREVELVDSVQMGTEHGVSGTFIEDGVEWQIMLVHDVDRFVAFTFGWPICATPRMDPTPSKPFGIRRRS